MYKGPLYIEEGKSNKKIIIFCVIVMIITIVIVVITGLLAYKMLNNDLNMSSKEEISGPKTVGKSEEIDNLNEENTEVVEEQENIKEENDVITFPKHDFALAMDSQLPQYSDAIAKKVVDVYYEETKKIYLTFDDGPSRLTDDVLDILKKYDVKATFFVLGNNVKTKPDVVKRAYEEGHFIASHGYTHVYSEIYSSPQAVLNEYNYCIDAIRNAIGVPNYNPHLFRFPGGSSGGKYEEVKRQAIELLKQNQITYTNWNCLTGDSAGSTTVEQMWNELNNTASGDDNLVILMHDAGDKEVTVQFLPQLIEHYQSLGYEFANYYDVMTE